MVSTGLDVIGSCIFYGKLAEAVVPDVISGPLTVKFEMA